MEPGGYRAPVDGRVLAGGGRAPEVHRRGRLVRMATAAASVVALAAGLAGCDSNPPTTTLFAWETGTRAPTARFEANGAAVGGGVYVMGGFGSTLLNAVVRSDRYDVVSGTWRRIADLPVAVHHAGTATDGTGIWLVGGTVGSWGSMVDTAAVRRYDPATDRWTEGPPLPAARSAGAAAVVGRVLHFAGGRAAGGIDAVDHWGLDLDDLSAGWVRLAPIPSPRNHLGGASLGGAFYAVGGQTAFDEQNGNRTHVERYDPGTDRWTAVAPLPAGRGHIAASTFASDGRLVVAGGSGNGGLARAEVVAYDPAADTWVALPALPAPRTSGVAGIVGGRFVYTTGIGQWSGTAQPATETWRGLLPGRWERAPAMPAALGEVASGVVGRRLVVVGEYDTRTFAYDLAAQTWSTRASRPFAGNHHAAEVVNGRLYLFGGLGGGSPGKVQIYDPVSDQWRLGADMPFAAGSSSSARIGGLVYVAGGIVGAATTTAAAAYDPVADRWTPVASMPAGRNHAASGTDGRKLYVIGGRGPGSGDGNAVANGFATLQVYDPGTNSWATSDDPGSGLLPLPQARGGMGKAVFAGGELYVVGGETSTGAGATADKVYRRVDVYDVAAGTWRLGTPMPTARHGIFPVAVAGRAYVAGGGTRAGGLTPSTLLEVLNLGR